MYLLFKSQILSWFEATNENDLEIAMVVLHGGTHIDNDEKRAECLHRKILWDECCKIGLKLKHPSLKATVANSNFKNNSVANRTLNQPVVNREPMQNCRSERTGVYDRTKVFVRPLEQEYSGHAEGESDLKPMCQPGERTL